MASIEYKKAEDLHFDLRNPRLVEFKELKTEEDILKSLWDNMAVNEIVMSILANGFFENEAMNVVYENGKFVVVEGNRRLAAVKAILHPDEIKGMSKYKDRISEQLKKDLTNHLPVIVLKKRQDAWRYIGFKHVNGAVKWDSYAKAQYIAQVYNDYDVPLDQIAEQIGDSSKITQKLYQGLMILRQADCETNFKIDDVYYKRVYFSHIYTAMSYESFQDYLGLDVSQNIKSPVPEERLGQLEEVMYWILGSRSKSIKPIIRSQNPDVRKLSQVLASKEATLLLKSSQDLDAAYDRSMPGDDVFYQALLGAQMALQKALSKVAYYKGDQDMLSTAGNLFASADSLFSMMEKIVKQTAKKSNGSEEGDI